MNGDGTIRSFLAFSTQSKVVIKPMDITVSPAGDLVFELTQRSLCEYDEQTPSSLLKWFSHGDDQNSPHLVVFSMDNIRSLVVQHVGSEQVVTVHEHDLGGRWDPVSGSLAKSKVEEI